MPLSLQKLHIRALRGVVDLPLDIDGKSVAILGENGFGKSSIVDGLEFFFTGRIRALEGTQGISTTRHGPHVGMDSTATSVTVVTNPGAVSTTRTFVDEPRGEGAVASMLVDGSSGNFILRRAQLLEFILTRPAERYQAISPLIGLEDLDRRELELKSLRDDLRGVVEARQGEHDAAAREATEAVGAPSTDSIDVVLTTVDSMRVEVGLPPFGTTADVVTGLPDSSAPLPAGPISPELEAATRALALLPNGELFPRLQEELRGLQAAAGSLRARRNLDQLQLLDFLRQGHEYLRGAETSECPLCEQPVVRESLITAVEARIRDLDSLSAEATTYREKLAAAREDLGRVEQRLTDLHAAISPLEVTRTISESISVARTQTTELKSRLDGAQDPLTLPDALSAEEFIRDLQSICDGARVALQGVLSSGRAHSRDSAVRLAASTAALVRWRQATRGLLESQGAFATASLLFDNFVAARREAVDGLYQAIQTDLTRFYSRVHPGEDHRDIVLRPSPGRRASTILHLRSFGQAEVDPRAYASEAHLDTLGLCIFLAFAKGFLAGFPLLVLDDVLTTVDASHRLRVAELLVDEFPSTQLLVTTHDAIWFEEFRALAKAGGSEGRFLFYTITSWTKESGPDVRQIRPTWTLIQAHIASGERELAGNESRRYAEWVTTEICSRTDASLPFSAIERLELGALLPSAKRRLAELVHDPAIRESFVSDFRSIESTAFLVNLLSHNNTISWNVTTEEVRAFATAVEGLRSRFSCGGCGSLLAYSRDLHELACPRGGCENKTRFRTH